jgi:hypothetical protein
MTIQASETYENITAYLIMPDAKLRAKTGCVTCEHWEFKYMRLLTDDRQTTPSQM